MAMQQQQQYGREDALMEQFRAIAARYEISDYFAKKLKQLEGWEIVLILDDSGSMNTPLADQGANASAFAKSVTRWDELKQTVGIIVDIGQWAMRPPRRDCGRRCVCSTASRRSPGAVHVLISMAHSFASWSAVFAGCAALTRCCDG